MSDYVQEWAAIAVVQTATEQFGAAIRPCRCYEWSDELHTTVARGFGYRAVYRDAQRGPIRRNYAAARRDARNGVTAPPREDVSAREGTGS